MPRKSTQHNKQFKLDALKYERSHPRSQPKLNWVWNVKAYVPGSPVCTDESRMSMTGEAFLSRPHCPDSLRSSVCTDEIAGRARNDGIGHPGPDPGSNSLVCTDEHNRHA